MEHQFSPSGAAHQAGDDNEVVFGELLGLSREKINELKEREVLR
jgi:hypothetical protein